jgi:hypothetical protein
MNVPISLVFCNPRVDPSFVTEVLGLSPTLAKREPHLGTWKLTIPYDSDSVTLEEQIQKWTETLGTKTVELHRLQSFGYAPYLDLRVDSSVYIEPTQLRRLGELGVGLSVWLYEHSGVTSESDGQLRTKS